MAGDGKPQPAIPAWQRSQQPSSDKPRREELDGAKEEEEIKVPGVEDEVQQHSPNVESLEDVTREAQTSNPPDHTFSPSNPPISAGDFEKFQNQQKASDSSISQQTVRTSAPPIITYPEFLVEAHRPPPLITPARIWNTAYVVSGIAAVLYGASKYLVAPMSDSLNGARHDFAAHSLSKVDELNERLSKLVSKIPQIDSVDGLLDIDETESEASDPAELYHRNVGTQTSPISSRENSMLAGTKSATSGDNTAATATEGHIKSLTTIKEQMDDLLERSATLGTAYKARQDKVDDLLAYLDTTIYASPHISNWTNADHFGSLKDGDGDDLKDDAVDGLKKEIRAIKGLMLSAKRFPGVSTRVSTST